MAVNGVVILNPNAGQAEAGTVVRRFAAQRGLEIYETAESGDARRAARDAVDAGRAWVVVIGGDGTLSEVVNGLAPDFDAVQLLIVPAGTANDFARTLNLPSDAEAALALIDTGREMRIDLAEMTDEHGKSHYILNAATGGFSEQVHAQLDDEMKQNWGALAYLRAAMQAISEPRLFHARLDVDGKAFQASAYSIVIANGRFVGGGMPVAPRASPEDHRLDLLAITSADFLSHLRGASDFVLGNESEASGALIQRGEEIRVETTPTMQFISDGEPLGQTPAVFRVRPGALRVIAPEPASGG